MRSKVGGGGGPLTILLTQVEVVGAGRPYNAGSLSRGSPASHAHFAERGCEAVKALLKLLLVSCTSGQHADGFTHQAHLGGVTVQPQAWLRADQRIAIGVPALRRSGERALRAKTWVVKALIS